MPEDEVRKKNPPANNTVHRYEWRNKTSFEVSDDPNNPYVQFYTNSGSQFTVWPNGDVTEVCIGDRQKADFCGTTASTGHQSDISTGGHKVDRNGGGSETEVTGKDGMAAGSDVAFVVMGKANIRCQSAYIGSDKDLNINCGGNCDMRVKGNMTTTVGGTYKEVAKKIEMN